MISLDKNYQINELVYESRETLIYRGERVADRQSVIIKLIRSNYVSSDEVLLFQNQYNIMKSIDLRNILKVISFKSYKNDFVLVLEDFGESSLGDYFLSLKPQELSSENIDSFLRIFFPIAIQLTDILGELYTHCIIHKDIKSANIQIDPKTQLVKLSNFGHATKFDRKSCQISTNYAFEGTLTHASPEQTGRTDRGIDYRSDFYALGVTFYELLTGKLPFDVNDPIELIHCHLAKLPIPADKVNSSIPSILAAIVSKLMAKNADERYQSALGLKHDLEHCWLQWQAVGKIEDFDLGKKSLFDRFIIPEKLYGREIVVQIILNTLERVAQGSPELVLLSGFFGVGKTAVIDEVQKLTARQPGYFIRGEFSDPLEQTSTGMPNIPFSAFSQALRSLMGKILSEDNDRLAKYSEMIRSIVGDNGQIIIDVIPELEKIIGQQPAATSLSEYATKHRFDLLFQQFVKILTTGEQPLVIFLDNLQWIDDDSLQLLELLMQDGKQLLIICAYRDNELSGIHPLMFAVNQLRQAGVAVNNIMLSPLSEIHINELVADSFNCNIDSVRSLAKLVYQKTNGNPFFAIKFLKSLEHDGLVKFNPQMESWQCDLSQIKIQSLTNDEIDLMAIQLQRLPQSTQEILKLAACLGMQFDLPTLAMISQQSAGEVAQILWAALQEGAIVAQAETYNFHQLAVETVQIDRGNLAAYQFSHDRVQQAAYSLIPEPERADAHDWIGELLLEQLVVAAPTPSAQSPWMEIAAGDEDRLFMVINQLNYGIGLTLARSKRDLLLRLNLTASRQARAANNYLIALKYAQIGLQLLDGAVWQQEDEIALTVYELAIEVAALCGEFELMNRWIEETISHIHTPLDRVNVCIVQIQSLIEGNRPVAAIALACTLLEQLDVPLPASPTMVDVDRAMWEIDDLIRDRSIAALSDSPMMTDPHQQGIIQVAASIMPVSYLTNPLLYALIVSLQVNLSIQFGNNSISAHSYASYGTLINNYRQDPICADRFKCLAEDLLTLPNSQDIRSETLAAIGLFLHHRNAHLREGLTIFRAGYQAGLASGKLEYVGYHIEGLCEVAYWCGENLAELAPQIQAYHQELVDRNLLITANYCTIYWETILVLLGNPDKIELAFDRVADEDLLVTSKDLVRVFLFYFHRAMLRFLAGDIAAANADALRVRAYIGGVAGLIFEAEFYFYDSLIALAATTESPTDLAICQARVRANQQQLAHWAKSAPMNHLHKWQLVEAETSRVFGDKAAAIELYDLAIAGAVEHEYIQEAALANELSAKFYLTWGKTKLAADYLQTAYDDYSQWGATAKLHDLASRYPQLLAEILPPLNFEEEETLVLPTVSGRLRQLEVNSSVSYCSNLDLNAHIKAIQALYAEIDLDRLLRTLMDIVVENAGADKAALLLNHDGNLTIAIEYDDGELDTLDFDLHSFDREYRLPLFSIRHVHRTLETEIYNGNNNPYLASDPYFEEHQPQSILCMPILNQSNLIGILYLENSLTSGAFTHERVELLHIICTQAAISLENARLHQESQAYAQRLEQSLLNLQFSEARLHRVADHIPGAIAQLCTHADRDTETLRYISSGCYEIYELTATEMIDGGYSLRHFEHPDDRAEVDRAIQKSRQHQIPLKLEFRIITPSGQVKWIYLTASSPELQVDGSFVNECTILDISDRQAALYERKQAELKLHATNEELIRSNRLKDQFLANMSHELRTPLNAILGMTEGLQEQVFGPINQEQITSLDTIEQSGNHLLSLINDILELAKIEAGKLEIHRIPTAIVPLCESSLVFIKQQAAQKQIQVDVKIQPNLPNLNIDERRIRQVLINLLTNAVKFTSAGGQIGLEVAYLDTPDFDRDLTYLQEIDEQGAVKPIPTDVPPTVELKERVRITVTDTGIGISPDNIKKLFQPFIQIDGALNRQFEGTGLGLALVKRIVDLHGGKVDLSSELGLGSSFTVDLPCDKMLAIAPPSIIKPELGTLQIDRPADSNSNRAPLILLVEDNEANVNTMSSYLKAKGYQIVLANNGRAAISQTSATSPDVILMDIQMPVMDGLTAIEQIREFSDIPIIAVTALASIDDREQCLGAGANEYLAKPLKLKQLTTMIQQLLIKA